MLHFSADSTIHAAPSLFTPPGAITNEKIIYSAILICVYLPYYDASRMTGSGQGHWVASSKSTAEATLLAPVFYYGAPQGLSVRLPRFRCLHRRALPVFPHDKSPANAAGGSNIAPRLAKQPDTGRPIGTIWEWLAAAALGCVRCAPQTLHSSTSRDTIKNPGQMRRSFDARYGLSA